MANNFTTCPDCAVNVGERHERGCDVARCTKCGWQELGCVPLDGSLAR